jgi:hypothetical protein
VKDEGIKRSVDTSDFMGLHEKHAVQERLLSGDFLMDKQERRKRMRRGHASLSLVLQRLRQEHLKSHILTHFPPAPFVSHEDHVYIKR